MKQLNKEREKNMGEWNKVYPLPLSKAEILDNNTSRRSFWDNTQTEEIPESYMGGKRKYKTRKRRRRRRNKKRKSHKKSKRKNK